MFISYESQIDGLIITDTEFTVKAPFSAKSIMHFDAFIECYQNLNKLNKNNILKFLLYYQQTFAEPFSLLDVHKTLMINSKYYPKYSKYIEKYLLWS